MKDPHAKTLSAAAVQRLLTLCDEIERFAVSGDVNHEEAHAIALKAAEIRRALQPER